MARDRRLIPLSLRSNKLFVADLKAMANEPFQVLSAVAEEGVSSPTPEKVVETATKFGKEETEVFRAAATLLFLRTQAINEGVEPDKALEELREALPEDVEPTATEGELRSLFTFSAEVQQEIRAVRAFSSGNPYLGSRVVPCLVPTSEEDDRLVSGFLLTLRFQGGSDDEKRAVTVAFSPGELQALQSQIEEAREQLDRIQGQMAAARRRGE